MTDPEAISSEELEHRLTRPTAEGLEAMAAALGGKLRVARVRRVGGGLGSATSAIQLRAPSGRAQRVVLKRYPRAAGSPRPEWERLLTAQLLEVPSPEPLALDEAGEWFGTPALVISYLPGKPSLSPPRLDVRAREIATAIVKIQSLDPARAIGVAARDSRSTWTRPEHIVGGPLFERAVETVEELYPKRSKARALCHGDFHPGNMLFRRERLSGIVDWSETGSARNPSTCPIAEPSLPCSSGSTRRIICDRHTDP